MNRPSSFAWRPSTTKILVLGLAVLLVYSVGVYMVTNFRPTTELRIGSGVYHLWLADTEAKRVQGLSGVESLSPDGGMLFDFEDDKPWGIWMKDMKIPLDIIWMDQNKEVVYIVKNADPQLSTETVFKPKSKARYVVELPAGSVDNAGIKTGMAATFEAKSKGGL